MKKIIVSILLVFLFMFTLTGCEKKHTWSWTSDKNEEKEDNNESTEGEKPDSPLIQPREVESNYSETITNWYEETKEDKYVITVLGATYCGYCKEFKPIIENVSDETGITLKWFYVDEIGDEDSNAIETLYNLQETGSVPYMFITKNGELVTYNVGYLDKTNLLSFLKEKNIKIES